MGNDGLTLARFVLTLANAYLKFSECLLYIISLKTMPGALDKPALTTMMIINSGRFGLAAAVAA